MRGPNFASLSVFQFDAVEGSTDVICNGRHQAKFVIHIRAHETNPISNVVILSDEQLDSIILQLVNPPNGLIINQTTIRSPFMLGLVPPSLLSFDDERYLPFEDNSSVAESDDTYVVEEESISQLQNIQRHVIYVSVPVGTQNFLNQVQASIMTNPTGGSPQQLNSLGPNGIRQISVSPPPMLGADFNNFSDSQVLNEQVHGRKGTWWELNFRVWTLGALGRRFSLSLWNFDHERYLVSSSSFNPRRAVSAEIDAINPSTQFDLLIRRQNWPNNYSTLISGIVPRSMQLVHFDNFVRHQVLGQSGRPSWFPIKDGLIKCYWYYQNYVSPNLSVQNNYCEFTITDDWGNRYRFRLTLSSPDYRGRPFLHVLNNGNL